jgi:hypothetical protein
MFLRKKEGRKTYQGWYRDRASPSFRWDRDKGAGTSSSSGGTTIGGPCGTSSSGRTTTRGVGTVIGGRSSRTRMSSSSSWSRRRPCRTRMSSSSSGTAVVTGYDCETSSSQTCMCFTWGTSSSSSLMCVTPNSSFIIYNVVCKNRNIPK